MKFNRQEQDSEESPIITQENENKKSNVPNVNSLQEPKKSKMNLKEKLLIIVISILIIFIIFKLNSRYNSLKENMSQLDQRIEQLEDMVEYLPKRKIGIGIVVSTIYGNGIGRVLTVFSEYLAKTGKYNVYLITEKKTDLDFPIYKEVTRVVQNKDRKEIESFDKIHNIDIYILNNDFSDYIEIYKSLRKIVIGIFHGVFLSCIFTNNIDLYRQWYRFDLFNSFVQIIPDDYYIYKKLQFKNVVFIPNLYTFEHTKIPESTLSNKNVLMVGRIDDVIKGASYGIKAFSETLKYVPDATLNILSQNFPPNIKNLVKELGIEKNVNYIPFTLEISKIYLNTSVLIVPSVSESFPMVMNEAKAHGLPIVAFNIDYCPCYSEGVITVDLFDYKAMGKEVANLLQNDNYRKNKGLEAKISLDMFKNSETINMWGELFRSLLKGKSEYRKFQKNVEKKYYKENIAKKKIRKTL